MEEMIVEHYKTPIYNTWAQYIINYNSAMLWIQSELNIHVLFELQKKLIEKGPGNATIANRSQSPTPYQSHFFTPQLIFGGWVVVLVFNGPSTLHVISSVVN